MEEMNACVLHACSFVVAFTDLKTGKAGTVTAASIFVASGILGVQAFPDPHQSLGSQSSREELGTVHTVLGCISTWWGFVAKNIFVAFQVSSSLLRTVMSPA